jgi:4-azaleucine resistance transporter AzlC
MRSFLRTSDPLVRDVAALCAAGVVVGISFGAIASAAHLPPAKTIAMSLLVYAGGAQFFAVGIAAAGGGLLAIVLPGLLLNARHLPFGLAIGDVIADSLPKRLLGSHLLTDEATAFTLARTDPKERRRAFWLTGLALFVEWNISTVIGAVIGTSIGDPTVFGVDAAFPAALLALLLPSLKEKPGLRVALVAAVVAVATTPFLPSGLPVLVALVGLVFALPVPTKRQAGS